MNDQDLQSTFTQPSKDERTWAMIAHLAALAGYVIPFGNIIGPLIVWAMKRQEMPFVNDQGKEALNFQITVTLVVVVCLALFFLVIPIFIASILGIVALVLCIIAALKANEGLPYRYPFTLRLVK